MVRSISGLSEAADFDGRRDFGDGIVRCEGEFFVEADEPGFFNFDEDFFDGDGASRSVFEVG